MAMRKGEAPNGYGPAWRYTCEACGHLSLYPRGIEEKGAPRRHYFCLGCKRRSVEARRYVVQVKILEKILRTSPIVVPLWETA